MSCHILIVFFFFSPISKQIEFVLFKHVISLHQFWILNELYFLMAYLILIMCLSSNISISWGHPRTHQKSSFYQFWQSGIDEPVWQDLVFFFLNIIIFCFYFLCQSTAHPPVGGKLVANL